MVLAITVILSAVLAGYVFRYPSKMKNVPSADFALSDCPEPLSSGKVFRLTEVSGDSLNPANLRIIIKNGSKEYVLNWNGSAFNDTDVYIPVNGIIYAGKSMVCYQTKPVFTGRTELKVEILYTPAGEFLFKSTVWVE